MTPSEIDALRQQLDSQGLKLRFPAPLEEEFQLDYARRYRTHMQLAILLGLAALLACGVIDPFWQPSVSGQLWTVRLLTVIPLTGLLLLSRLALGEKHMQPLAALASCLAVAGLVGLSITSLEPFCHYYSSAITLVMLIVFVLSRLQFGWGVGSALAMMAILNIGLFGFSRHPDLKIAVINNFVFAASAVFALVGTFLIERSLRQNYLQARLLNLQNSGLEESNLRLQYLTAIDGLTQIANRRSLDMTLTTEWQRAMRKGEPLGVVMIDVDHFKLFNDTYGHQAGDHCLQGVAGTLKDFARRPGDLAARYGGEEFVLVLTNNTAAQAQGVAERVRDKILALAIPHQCSSHGSVTASFGVASIVPTAQMNPEALLLAADQALYKAKESGRNRVVVNSMSEGASAVA